MFISAIILASTLMQALASLPSFQVEPSEVEKETLKRYTKWYNMPFGLTKPHPSILYADFCCHVILSIEFIVEFVVCPNRRSFMLSPVRIIVFVSYVSYWIDIMLELNLDKLANSHALNVYVVFKYMTILMLGRLFYITKQVPAFKILGLTFRSSKQELKILVFMLGVLVFGFGYTLFITELLQESEINNVFVAMYWALITLTTVGYGRYVPTSVLGHVVAGACALCGVLVLALPIGVIASAFYTFYYNHKYASKHLALAF
ncbi:hypothetical protein DPMN_024025 [Dreissena polymorpha]|uniref:Ion transport domain-containing protein n=2 Tax=Dreissena polymorpha TaxID=45954 RepID=A0A9D4LLW5_DREPO|nr:hypothetical protein DPMN_024025 [Dreissena polymorpha]